MIYLRRSMCLALLAVVPAFGQGANQPARITGRVVAAETGVPLRGVLVELVGGTPVPFVVTDGDGRFEFLEKRVGRYAVQAAKAGYVPYCLAAWRIRSIILMSSRDSESTGAPSASAGPR